MTDRDKKKHLYQMYQCIAKMVAEQVPSITMQDNPNVCMTENGAFIEMSLWIPLSVIEGERSSKEYENLSPLDPRD